MGSAWVWTALTFLLSTRTARFLRSGLQLPHVGHLNFDRHVERGEREIRSAAARVVRHLAQLDRILRADRDDGYRPAAIVIVEPRGRLRAHREDQIELVLLGELERLRAACLSSISKLIDRKFRIELLAFEHMQDLGDRDVVGRRGTRIQHQHAAWERRAARRSLPADRHLHRRWPDRATISQAVSTPSP